MERSSYTSATWRRSPVRRISTLLVLVAAIGLSLGLVRTWPTACRWFIVLVVLGAVPALFAGKMIAGMRDRGELVRIEDRMALFLSLALFTVPLQLYVFSQFVTYRAGWEPGPIGRLIYRWWLTVTN